MILRGALLRWNLWQISWLTLVGVAIAIPFVCFTRELLDWWSPWPMLFIFLHCVTLTVIFGRCSSGAFGFLYTRGYSRDAIWGHTMMATLISMLLVWLPAPLLIWTGFRSGLQDRMRSPYFPVMAPREQMSPIAWLIAYLLLISAFQYAWIRRAQSTRGPNAGVLLAIAVVAAGSAAIGMLRNGAPLMAWGSASLAAVALATFLIAGWRVHRSLEVRT